MKLWSDSFQDDASIPTEFAFGKYDPASHVTLSDNKSPHLAWDNLPAGTQSLVLVCHDPDVPSKPDDVNKEGRTVPLSLPRVDFYHWVCVDLPASLTGIQPGEFSSGVTPRGKGSEGPHGTRQGLNNYTQWFDGDAEMAGQYFGYDGPCPPWNDELVHRYIFTLYALDVERCPVSDNFTGPDVLKAIEGHVLDKAAWMGTYAIYPKASRKA